ncbi:MAG: hypothetical protein JJT75_00825 [Opitutales bacterium]|nr:hypothetical protein [Opitutales bacterium]MCH8541648.1 hypothetical protein [Opitutales bacterium]
MSLSLATYFLGFLFLLTGAVLVSGHEQVRYWTRRFPRSETAAWVLMAVAGGWFLWHVWNLGEADFGQFRGILFLIFATLAVLSCVYAKDFLSVRAACILFLLLANVFLSAAFMQEPRSRLFMVTPVYFGIILALYLTLSPFRLRDFIEWIWQEPFRFRLAGGSCLAYGLFLLILPLSY